MYILPGFNNRKCLIFWGAVEGCSPCQEQQIHSVGLIVLRPLEGGGNMFRCLVHTIVEVPINLSFGIVSFNESNSLFQNIRSISGFQLDTDEISVLIVIGMITKCPPTMGSYVNVGIFLIYVSICGVSLLHIKFWSQKIW